MYIYAAFLYLTQSPAWQRKWDGGQCLHGYSIRIENRREMLEYILSSLFAVVFRQQTETP